MIGNRIEQLKQLIRSPDWAIVRAGWEGAITPRLTVEEISQFACAQLPDTGEDELIDVADICSPPDAETVSAALERLAPTVTDSSKRPWRVLELKTLLDGLSDSPIDGLMELTSYWNEREFPEDMPHIVQGRQNTIPPEEYYSDDSYQRILARHRAWISAELAAINGGEYRNN